MQSDAHLFVPARTVTFLFSFSALEHIGNDQTLIERLSACVGRGGAQMHIVPAAAGLFVYLLHGYRQYTPAGLSNRFGADARFIRLGGAGTFVVHLLAITLPENILGLRFRKAFPSVYARLVLAGFALDRLLPIWPTALVAFKQH